MKDRDFIFPFPPWRLFVPFMIVTMFCMIHLGLGVAILTTTLNFTPKYSMLCLLIYSLLFILFNLKVTQGKHIHAYFLQVLCIINIILSTIGTILINNIDYIDNTILSIILFLSISSILFINSKYYKGFIYYRMRHIAVMYKIKDGKKLDDGKYFYEK